MVAGPVDLAGMTMTIGAPASIRCLGDLVGPVLGLVVQADEALGEVPPIRLVDEPAMRVAEHVDRRDVDDPRDAGGDRPPRGAASSCRRSRPTSPAARRLGMPDPVAAGGVDGPVGGPRCSAQPPTSDEVVLRQAPRRAPARARAFAGSRTSATTVSPRSRRRATTRAPDEPAPPVTTTRIRTARRRWGSARPRGSSSSRSRTSPRDPDDGEEPRGIGTAAKRRRSTARHVARSRHGRSADAHPSA